MKTSWIVLLFAAAVCADQVAENEPVDLDDLDDQVVIVEETVEVDVETNPWRKATLYTYPKPDQHVETSSQSWAAISAGLAHVYGVVEDMDASHQFRNQDHQQKAHLFNNPQFTHIAGSWAENNRPLAHLFLTVDGMNQESIILDESFAIEEVAPVNEIAEFATDLTELVAKKYGANNNVLAVYTQDEQDQRPQQLDESAVVVVSKEKMTFTAPYVWDADLKKTLQTLTSESVFSAKEHLSLSLGDELLNDFSIDSEPERIFMAEVDFFMQFFESLESQTRLEKDSAADFYHFDFNGLHKIKEAHGEDSIVYKNANQVMQLAIHRVIDHLLSVYNDRIAVELLSLTETPEMDQVDTSLPRRLVKRSTADTSCIADQATCESTFNKCSNHGSCQAVTTKGQTCYKCVCDTTKPMTDDEGKVLPGFSGPVRWTGDACQYQDVSVDFHLIFWVAVGLGAILLYGIGMLYNMGSSGTTEAGSVGKHAKSD